MMSWPTFANTGASVTVRVGLGFAVSAEVEAAIEAARAFVEACRLDALRRLPRLGLIFIERRPVLRRDVAVPDLPRLLARSLPRRQAR